MRLLVLALTFLCLVLAGTSIYLARQLAEERARVLPATPSIAADTRVEAPATPPASPGASAAAAPPVDVRAADPAKDPSERSVSVASEDQIRASQAQFAQAFLEQMSNPQAREDLVAERRMQIRQTYPAVDRVLGLSADEYSRLLDLLAEEQLQVQAEHSRCVVDPACDARRWNYSNPTHQQDVNALLGPARAQRYETYKNTLPEREAVTHMRSRLPETQRLSDANAEGLISALAEERNSMHRETSQRGSGTFGFGMGAGMLYAPSDGTPEAQYEAARQYSQRLRDRAASYLNAEQLRAFNEMQDEQLLGFRNMLRNKNGPYSAVTMPMP